MNKGGNCQSGHLASDSLSLHRSPTIYSLPYVAYFSRHGGMQKGPNVALFGDVAVRKLARIPSVPSLNVDSPDLSRAIVDVADTNHLNDDDHDSALGEDNHSSDVSLLLDPDVFENNRTYHSYDHETCFNPYPNDDEEQDRLDFQHAMFKKLHNGRLSGSSSEPTISPGTGSRYRYMGDGNE